MRGPGSTGPMMGWRTKPILSPVDEIRGEWWGKGKKIGVIVSRWNELVTKELLEGALDQLKLCGGPEAIVVHVPGTWELPFAAQVMVDEGVVHGIIALGCILQGATPHARMLAEDVSSALMKLQNETGVPIGWGVLTPDTQEQAMERSGLKLGNKGREAAIACLEMVSLVDQVRAAKQQAAE